MRNISDHIQLTASQQVKANVFQYRMYIINIDSNHKHKTKQYIIVVQSFQLYLCNCTVHMKRTLIEQMYWRGHLPV